MANKYVIVGAGWIADGTGTTDSTRRLVPGVNNINITGAGNLVVAMCEGTSAVAESDVATVTDSPKACPSATDTTITVTGTGNIKITCTYNTKGRTSSAYSYSASSGGRPNSSVPTSADNSIKDSNSFTATGQLFEGDATANCLDNVWTGVLYSPTYAVEASINCYGAITFIDAMTIVSVANRTLISRGTGKSITAPSAGIGNANLGVFAGDLTLLTNIITTGRVRVDAGEIKTNGKSITTATMGDEGSTNAKTFTLGASVITIVGGTTGWALTGSSNTVACGTSTIKVYAGPFAGGGKTYYIVELYAATHTVSGDNTYTTFTLPTGTTQAITFANGSNQTSTTFNLSGSAGHVHTLTGGTGATLTNTGAACYMDYVALNHITLVGDFFFGPHCTIGAGVIGGLPYQSNQNGFTSPRAEGTTVV